MPDDLILPKSKPRVPPLRPEQVNPYVNAAYDMSVRTWGIPNNLIRTMAWLPQLALTEVPYANAFIFDERMYSSLPAPKPDTPGETVPYPLAGFVDRVTKELVINLVSLLSRSRYSITHHSVIGYTTLVAGVEADDEKGRKQKAEQMLLNLVNEAGEPCFENKRFGHKALYSRFQLYALRLALKLRGDAHDVTDDEIDEIKHEMRKVALRQLRDSPLKAYAGDEDYVEYYVNSMLVELTWCIVHFAGLLNKWFTVLRVMDETDEKRDGVNFVDFYNKTVPASIKARNNALLRKDGWGSG
jgi:hypothetical protein